MPGPLFAFALAAISLIGPLAVHLFMPVIPAVRAALGLSAALAQLTFSIALFGMAISPHCSMVRCRIVMAGVRCCCRGWRCFWSAVRFRPWRRPSSRWCWAGWYRRSAPAADITLGRAIAQDVYGARSSGQGHRLSHHGLHHRPDDLADGRRHSDRRVRLAQRVRLRAGVSAPSSRSCAYHRRVRIASAVAGQIAAAAIFCAIMPTCFATRALPRSCCKAASCTATFLVDRNGGIEPAEGYAAPSVDRVRHLFPAVSVRVSDWKFHHQPHRQSRRQRDHGARRLAAVSWPRSPCNRACCSPAT